MSKENQLPLSEQITALLFGVAIALVILVPVLFYFIVVNGFVGMKLWAWFIVPTFGLKALTLTQSCGVSFLISFWTHQTYTQSTKTDIKSDESMKHLIGLALVPWMVLLMSWLTKTLIFPIFV